MNRAVFSILPYFSPFWLTIWFGFHTHCKNRVFGEENQSIGAELKQTVWYGLAGILLIASSGIVIRIWLDYAGGLAPLDDAPSFAADFVTNKNHFDTAPWTLTYPLIAIGIFLLDLILISVGLWRMHSK